MCKNKAVSGIGEYYVVHAANSVFVSSNSSMLHRKWSLPCSSSSLSVKITWSNLSALLISSVSKVNVSRVYWKTYRSERWRLCSRLSGAVMGTIRCLKSFEPSYPLLLHLFAADALLASFDRRHTWVTLPPQCTVHLQPGSRYILIVCLRTGRTPCNCAQRRIFFSAKPRLCTVRAMATSYTRNQQAVHHCHSLWCRNSRKCSSCHKLRISGFTLILWVSVRETCSECYYFPFPLHDQFLTRGQDHCDTTCTHSAVLQEPLGFSMKDSSDLLRNAAFTSYKGEFPALMFVHVGAKAASTRWFWLRYVNVLGFVCFPLWCVAFLLVANIIVSCAK